MTKFILLSTLTLTFLCRNSLCASEYQKQDTINDEMNIILNEIKIISSFSKKGREAVSLSTLSKSEIQNKLGSQEYVEVMKSIPSVYATKKGGGYGDSRIVLRGFCSSNIPVLINGIPANSMENSSMYWSNWAGLADVTGGIQVQRGIGLSKLGLFSVGGTINIITQLQTLDPEGQVFYKMGNDGYKSYGVSYSTGNSPNGWNLSLMGTRTAGDGYVNGTEFEAYTYYINLTKHFKNGHKLSLIAFGSPQWHNSRSNRHNIEDYQNHQDGIKMNTSYGYINGELVPTYGGYNEYNKPMTSLNHFWSISSKSYLSNIIYVSNAKGGGRRLYGKEERSEDVTLKYINQLQYNYHTGRPYDGSDRGLKTNLTPEGYIDYAPMMKKNRESTIGSYAIFANTINDHDWYGILSSYSNMLADDFRFTAGVDARYYMGYHYDEISDLLGGTYFQDDYLSLGTLDQKLKIGDKLGRKYYSQILWTGVFAQLEWKKENLNSFLSISTAYNSYKRTDEGKYYKEVEEYVEKDPLSTKWNNFHPYSIKFGSNYRFANYHKVYVNAGLSTRAPAFENIFINNVPIAEPIKEKVGTVEMGYGIASLHFSLYLTAYYTKWLDKNLVKAIGNWNGPRAYIPNVNALHKGFELDVTYEPATYVFFKGFFTIGDWKWTNDVSYTMVDENNVEIGEYNAYLKDLKVGNAPQMSAMLSSTFIPIKKLAVSADFNYYGMHYAEFSPDTRTDKDDRSQSWKLPNYNTVDININYNIELSNRFNMEAYGNINNLLNTEYISDALDGVDHNIETTTVWYGFAKTWVVGVKFNF